MCVAYQYVFPVDVVLNFPQLEETEIINSSTKEGS